MLERAARCVENARCVYLGTKHKVGSRRILHPNFWRQTIDDTEIPLWCIAFLNSSHSSSRRAITSSETPPFIANVHSTPLEFLYPLRSQPIAGAYTGSSIQRRRNKFLHRSYSSTAGESGVGKDNTESDRIKDDALDGADPAPRSNEEALRRVLANDRYRLYDEAWELYESVGFLREYNSELLHYLSTSPRPIDSDRSKAIFSHIPISERVERDYLYATRSVLRIKTAEEQIMKICLEAINRNQGKSSWNFAIAILINRGDWSNVSELWENRYTSSTNVFSPELSRLTTLPTQLSSLIGSIERNDYRTKVPYISDIAKFMIYHVVSNARRMMDTPLVKMMRLFERSRSIGLFEARHYYRAISTLQTSDIRAANTRAILLYREFRSRMPDERPPTRLLLGTLRMLCAREMSELVEYLLEEYTHFYKKPSNRAYQLALTTFARIGDVSHVENLFERYIAHFKKPTDQAILSPRLYVYARVGNVPETKRLFDNIKTDFGLTPNTVCWNVLLTAHARCDDLDGAISIFKEMPRAGVTPDSYSFGIIMGMLANRGDVDAIFKLLEIVKQENIPKTVAMIDTLVEALCNLRRYEEAERAANEAILFHPPETLSRCFNVLLWNYSFMIDLDSVSRVKDTMLQANIPYDGMTYAALMLGLVLVGKTEAARELFGSLHRGRKLHVSMFHYAILLHGYVKERNRDMVQVLYKEMEERFGDPGVSSKLAMLKTQIDRDLQRLIETEGDPENSIEFPHAEKFLRLAIKDFDVKSLTSKQPQPGTNKRPFRDAFPSIYYEHLIGAYSSEGAFEKASDIFSEYAQQEYPVGKPVLPTSLLHTLMVNYLEQGKHGEVKRCWEMVLEQTIQLARPVDMEAVLSPKDTPADKPDVSTNGPTQDSPFEYRPLSIISPYRFTLSRPLSTYMKSLYHQDRYDKIEDVLHKIGRLGFALTSHNLSLYINMLCLSRNPVDQLHAFTLFEGRFMPNFPGWKYIRRGYSKRPEGAPTDLDLLDQRRRRGKRSDMIGKAARLAWLKIQPDHMMPTYFTMIHLAFAMKDFRFRSFQDGSAEMQNLYRQAPATYNTVLNTPYLRDKLQGELLRGGSALYNRDDEEDTTVYPDDEVWTGGVLRPTGGPRINTAPRGEYSEDMEHEEGDAFTSPSELEPEPKLESEPLPETESEPGGEEMTALLEDDAEWMHKSAAKERRDSEPPNTGLTLAPEDEWDLRNDDYIDALRTGKGSGR